MAIDDMREMRADRDRLARDLAQAKADLSVARELLKRKKAARRP